MFKKYDQKQQFLLPISLEDFIAEDHISRILNDIIDAIDITTIESKYSEEGCPAGMPGSPASCLSSTITNKDPIIRLYDKHPQFKRNI
jgi:hypothetical protein